jgi:hypothetical protein
MNFKIRSIFIILLGVVSQISTAEELRCLGNDGGTPFANISNDVSLNQRIVQSRGHVKDYVFQEKINQIVYRNELNQIRALDLSKQSDRHLSYSAVKISHVTDEERGRILASESTYFLDSVTDPFWRTFAQPNQVGEHLFLDKGDIYSLEAFWQEESTLLTDGRYRFSFLTYESNQSWRRECKLPGSVGQSLKIAKGNLFPYLYFTTIKSGLIEDRVVVYRMEVNKAGGNRVCPYEEVTSYPFSKIGTINSFYYFNIDGTDAFAFHLTDPKRNLFWDKPGECAYYNFKGKTPIFISPKHPIFATWKNGEGLSLHNLREKTEVTLFQKMDQPRVATENLWISSDEKTLFSSLSPKKNDPTHRLIVATKIK